jgi:hypothetical protein
MKGQLLSLTIVPHGFQVHARGVVTGLRLDEIDLRPTLYESLAHHYNPSAVWGSFTALAGILLALVRWQQR